MRCWSGRLLQHLTLRTGTVMRGQGLPWRFPTIKTIGSCAMHRGSLTFLLTVGIGVVAIGIAIALVMLR
jgi:hypothetical protein